MTTEQPDWLTPEQVAARTPTGNADWVRQQLRTGKLRGSKIGGAWWVSPEAVAEMVAAASNSTARPATSRRRRQRSIA
jgi:hypothetical protein